MKFISNDVISIQIDGKTSRAVQKEIVAAGGNIGETSVRYIMTGKREVANGFKIIEKELVETVGRTEALNDYVFSTFDPDQMDEEVHQMNLEDAKEILPVESVVEQISKAQETLSDDEEITIQVTVPNPFANMLPQDTKDLLKRLSSKADGVVKADPKAAEDTPRQRLIIDFTKKYPDLVAKVNAIEGTVLMRAAQGRILLLKNTRWAQGYFHLNVIKNGYTLSAYVGGKSVRGTVKEHSLDDIVSAYSTKVAELSV